jgi:hypothetical protein
MATRRLIAALIALLVLSSVAAILVPDPDRSSRSRGSSTTRERTTSTAEPQHRGRSVHATLDARSRKNPTVVLRVGDRLTLEVVSRSFDQVEVGGFGAVEAVDRYAPAAFDLLATRPGRFEVRLVGADRVVGTIRVRRDGPPPT